MEKCVELQWHLKEENKVHLKRMHNSRLGFGMMWFGERRTNLAMCFQQEWGTCPDFFLFYKKIFIIHPILITYFEISNTPILEVNLFIIPFSHLNQNVM